VTTATHTSSGTFAGSWRQIEDEREVAQTLAHLQRARRDPVYLSPELYDLAYPGYPGDRDFYLTRAKTGRVLYLGVGTGRIFKPLARLNRQTIGVESSPAMWEVLRGHCPELADRVQRCDAAAAQIPANSLDTVIAPYSFLQVVGRTRLPELLTRVHAWLKPGGGFLTDTFSPYLIPFRGRGLEASAWRAQEGTKVSIYVQYDHFAQQMQELALIERPDCPACVLEMRLDYCFPVELVAFLRSAQFEAVNVFGGFAGEPFEPATNSVLVYEAIKS
jgi:SAM-dependent methyltransferase